MVRKIVLMATLILLACAPTSADDMVQTLAPCCPTLHTKFAAYREVTDLRLDEIERLHRLLTDDVDSMRVELEQLRGKLKKGSRHAVESSRRRVSGSRYDSL